jgi:hypothetical protein
MMNDAHIGQEFADELLRHRSSRTDFHVRFQGAAGPYMILASKSLPVRASCELSVKSVPLGANAMSDSMQRRFAEARVYAAQVRARKAMGSKWILAYVQKHR